MSARLFEQTENNSPNEAQRIAFGRAGYATENMTITNFLAYLLSSLGFLKVASNLSDLNNVGTARTNLSVYSQAEITSLLSGKQATITATGWNNGTRVSTDVELASFICKANQWGNVVTVNGQLKLTGSDSGTLFTLPTQVGVPTVDIYFTACDADGSTSESIELKVSANTRNVIAVDSSQDRVSSYNFTYIV